MKRFLLAFLLFPLIQTAAFAAPVTCAVPVTAITDGWGGAVGRSFINKEAQWIASLPTGCGGMATNQTTIFVSSFHVSQSGTYVFEGSADDRATVRILKNDTNLTPITSIDLAASYTNVPVALSAGNYTIIADLRNFVVSSGLVLSINSTEGVSIKSTANDSSWTAQLVENNLP